MKELKSYKGLTGIDYAKRTKNQKTKPIWIFDSKEYYQENDLIDYETMEKIRYSKIKVVIKKDNLHLIIFN